MSEPARELVVVPWRDLEPSTVTAIIESFVLREGTNYGANEYHFSTKVEQVRSQLEAAAILLVYDGVEDSCTLLTEQQLNRVKKQHAVAATQSENSSPMR